MKEFLRTITLKQKERYCVIYLTAIYGLKIKAE